MLLTLRQKRWTVAAAAASAVASLFLVPHNAIAADRLPGPMLAEALEGPMAGVEEIVFAVRSVGGDGQRFS